MLLGERPPVTSEGDTLRVAGCKQAFLFVHEQNQRALAIAPMDRFASRTSGALHYARCASSKISDTGGTRPVLAACRPGKEAERADEVV